MIFFVYVSFTWIHDKIVCVIHFKNVFFNVDKLKSCLCMQNINIRHSFSSIIRKLEYTNCIDLKAMKGSELYLWTPIGLHQLNIIFISILKRFLLNKNASYIHCYKIIFTPVPSTAVIHTIAHGIKACKYMFYSSLGDVTSVQSAQIFMKSIYHHILYCTLYP